MEPILDEWSVENDCRLPAGNRLTTPGIEMDKQSFLNIYFRYIERREGENTRIEIQTARK